MKSLTRLLPLVLTAAASASGAFAADAPHPQVIELYQSQGCSSCPPANAVLNGLADRKDLITLSFAVTYWDNLGWKDRFAQPAFTQRQYDYAGANHRPNVATPQMVINGRGFITGTTVADVAQGLAHFSRKGAEPDIALNGKQVTIGAGNGAATVWLVRYDPKVLNVPVTAGENDGRILPHRHIVKQLISLGQWNGKTATFAAPAPVAGLDSAVLLQAGKGGPIVAAKAF